MVCWNEGEAQLEEFGLCGGKYVGGEVCDSLIMEEFFVASYM